MKYHMFVHYSHLDEIDEYNVIGQGELDWILYNIWLRPDVTITLVEL